MTKKVFEGRVDSGYDAGEFPHLYHGRDTTQQLDYKFQDYLIKLRHKKVRITIEVLSD